MWKIHTSTGGIEVAKKEEPTAPLTVVSKAWQRHVVKDNGQVDRRAYTFCWLSSIASALDGVKCHTGQIDSAGLGNEQGFARSAAARLKEKRP